MGRYNAEDSTLLVTQSLTKPAASPSFKRLRAEDIQLDSKFYIQDLLYNLFFTKIKTTLRGNCLVPERKARILSSFLLDQGHVFFQTGGVLFNGPVEENSERTALKAIQDLVKHYRNLRENRRVFHLLLHSPAEHDKRFQQFVSYATVNPQINTSDFEAADNNAVIAAIRNWQHLQTVLENFIDLSVALGGKLEAMHIVFNFHGKPGGTIQLNEEEDDVKVDEVIEFLQHCRADKSRLGVSQATDLYLIFAQCHGHSFNQDKAKQCDLISDIWWFTSDQYPATINFMSPKMRLEHLELMRYARNPLKQKSLRMMGKEKELERLKIENEQLKLQIAAMKGKDEPDKQLNGKPADATYHQETMIDTTSVLSDKGPTPQWKGLLPEDQVLLDSDPYLCKDLHSDITLVDAELPSQVLKLPRHSNQQTNGCNTEQVVESIEAPQITKLYTGNCYIDISSRATDRNHTLKPQLNAIPSAVPLTNCPLPSNALCLRDNQSLVPVAEVGRPVTLFHRFALTCTSDEIPVQRLWQDVLSCFQRFFKRTGNTSDKL